MPLAVEKIVRCCPCGHIDIEIIAPPVSPQLAAERGDREAKVAVDPGWVHPVLHEDHVCLEGLGGLELERDRVGLLVERKVGGLRLAEVGCTVRCGRNVELLPDLKLDTRRRGRWRRGRW